MSHGPGRLQRAILDVIRRYALHQRSPQREHWKAERLALNVIPPGAWSQMSGRQRADMRKQVRRACGSLVRSGLVVSVGIGWQLPPETPAEARARRKRTHTSERREREQQEQEQRWQQRTASFAEVQDANRSLQPATHRKLVSVLGMLGSQHDGEVLAAARQVERLRKELGLPWDQIIPMRRK